MRLSSTRRPGNLLPPIAQVTVPTLLLWSDRDQVLGHDLLKGQERFCEHIRVVCIDKCSHWIQQDQPEAVVEEMRSFLKAASMAPAPASEGEGGKAKGK